MTSRKLAVIAAMSIAAIVAVSAATECGGWGVGLVVFLAFVAIAVVCHLVLKVQRGMRCSVLRALGARGSDGIVLHNGRENQ